MWPTESIWGNVLIFAAVGYAMILSAALGSVLGQSGAGRKVLGAAPFVLAVALVAYVGTSLVLADRPGPTDCLYDKSHPSEC
ncbi:hypothetical protein [Reyranella sp.]|uniref:hypothetical protein n=1 Tax=Reyranella sp. TaxID=1929291 RepID=UPI003BA89E94